MSISAQLDNLAGSLWAFRTNRGEMDFVVTDTTEKHEIVCRLLDPRGVRFVISGTDWLDYAGSQIIFKAKTY